MTDAELGALIARRPAYSLTSPFKADEWIDAATDAIRALLRERSWVACIDRLPAEGYISLIYAGDHDFVATGWYDARRGWCDTYGDRIDFPITHWQQLPEPPQPTMSAASKVTLKDLINDARRV